MDTNKPKLSAGFFFLSLGVLITLITSVTSFLNLVFSTLNKKFPDVLNATYQYGYSTYDFEGMRMSLAILIIFFPLFLVSSYFWNKYTKSEMGAGDKVLRKWLIYIILFLSSLTLAIDLVTLIKYFISGEITVRFIWKIIAVIFVAVMVGKYYIFQLWDKKFFGWKLKNGMPFAVVSILVALLAVIYSFNVMGSPMSQRELRLDDRRVNDLQNIQYQIINYWQQKEKFPESLKDLSSPLSGFSLPIDPEFEKGKVYEYSVKDAKKLTFELCATFSKPMPKGWREYSDGKVYPMYAERDMMSYPYPGGGVNDSWDHDAGKTCFERTIDPDMYPPFSKPNN